MMSPSFTLFPKLPPELRIQIWEHALPVIGPALCRHREGLWHPREIQPGDKDYSQHLPNVCVDFRPEWMIQILVDHLPLILVNHEAHLVALKWAREHGIRRSPQANDDTFVRPFNPQHDIIYVEVNQITDFDRACQNQCSKDNLTSDGGRIRLTERRPERVAISEMAFRRDDVEPRILSLINHAHDVFVIVGEQPDFEGLWEVDSSRGRSVIWNRKKMRFEMGEGEFITDEGLYKIIEENKKSLSEDLRYFVDLKITPAFAVRR
ncbi:uncharacterized protein NECHADRAFT_80806 [Fusarium vanettenii 77-13-4]|uniref:2EXR domain-containing protein n=1 Tax=Fusarium vanettenii (strain ATCC MYA-4622 / CBS 123669 / FGSC 9596 / NRRL 45880 / 77-13-4) TaxID=660122 RepID=C7YSP4_FUSV7|nr:uncharacterized protein NECHADRAFT_80806 [Fusarium vanettenii 77-13-4]EEU45677.1 hypothetical protein NECHADRAFT_80806 [Fusarium vanettenii 77-13-4]